MSKVSLSNRKRTNQLGQNKDFNQDKKDELLTIQLQQINQQAENIGTLKTIMLNELLPDPNQPRKLFKNIDALAQSMEKKGIIQPIIVTPKKEDGFYHIIAGERRFRAAKKAGFNVMPCILRQEHDSDILILQLLENEQREKVSPFEEADALAELVNNRKISKTKVAQSLGRDPAWISMRLKLSSASSTIRQLSEAGYIEDVRTLYELKKLEDELPALAHDFIKKVRQKRVKGAYREAIKRTKDTWEKQQVLESTPNDYIGIEEIVWLDHDILGFKASRDHGHHIYPLKLSTTALQQIKDFFLDNC